MKSQKKQKKKAFVGLSGGVDSSVSAALLIQAGYDVTGVFIKVWQPDWIECTWKEDRLDAMRVCAKLGIPFVTLDLSAEYKKDVVDYMIAEYKAGRTPNPDVMCNRYVKFGGFFDWAMKQGADYVATGHYAQIKKAGSGFSLVAGADSNKDQSYFLWTLTQKQLAHTLFPVGHIEKPAVRTLAKKFGLPTAAKKDSQGLCFIGKINVKDFLSRFIKAKKGAVLDESGKTIGSHTGAIFFTLGERHGFITQKNAEQTRNGAEDQRPYYVVAKDSKKNTLTVSHNPLYSASGEVRKEFTVGQAHWIGRVPKPGSRISARIRYRQPLQEARFKIHESRITIQFKEPQEGGAPGQSIVFYDGKTCLGGGVIV